jgi:broad specificity polyphosphatase/5'/3'-nucleotidase SurE
MDSTSCLPSLEQPSYFISLIYFSHINHDHNLFLYTTLSTFLICVKLSKTTYKNRCGNNERVQQDIDFFYKKKKRKEKKRKEEEEDIDVIMSKSI